MLRFTAHHWSLLALAAWSPGPSLPARALSHVTQPGKVSTAQWTHTFQVRRYWRLHHHITMWFRHVRTRGKRELLKTDMTLTNPSRILNLRLRCTISLSIYVHTYLHSHQIFFLRSILKAQLQFCTQWKDFVASANCTRSNLKHWMVEKNFPQPAWQTDDRS